MKETEKCPCCGRHCELSNPHCKRGKEYAKKEIKQEDKKERKKKNAEPELPYDSLNREEQLVVNLRESGNTLRYVLEGKGRKRTKRVTVKLQKRHRELFSGLSEEEMELMLSLLEKLNKDWENRNLKT